MDRADLSAAMIQELGAVLTAALDDALPASRGSDLAAMEQRVRTLGRAVWGPVITRVIRLHATRVIRLHATRVIRLHATRGAEERRAWPRCGGARGRAVGARARVDGARVRRLQGLVGGYTLHRVY